ncbi:efflux RND transporter periplasmic adaptor subunit [Polynucleobacter sp. MG-27-Goln-C1]|uniref:efflux RND transporter periplasmic adaptor subunit n=1 Tax=Polynucleobacter sp. MG-27-Goln-C1 TaxID=1819726 RepID=UPI001C0E2493|nr:efflux RND transporter periplasmic adaptor subunit [Polynucleobacter sp. MG-27-Goln-C1]MBU3611675.1 efflux RND transporter periplasmic adaptor subunit [Polynucleobacter sp. MG-27-Goln-C1]
MKDLLIKTKILLMPLWRQLETLWRSLLAKWNEFLAKLSTVEIPILKKKLEPRTIGISLFVLFALILLVCLKSCGKEVKRSPTPVTTAQPLSQEIRSFATFDGLVDPYLTVNLDARVKGYLTKIGFADGAMVKKGDLLFVIEQDPYIQEVKLKQAIYNEAKSEYGRQKSLLKENATSQAAVDKALSQYQQAEANLTLAKINLGYTEIRAPFDGLMGRHLLDVGAYLDATTKGVQLSTIQQISPIYVYFSINERDFLKFQKIQDPNMERKSEVNTLPIFVGLQSEVGYPHEGVLDYAANLISTDTGSLQLRAIFKNENYQLIPGLYARVMAQYGEPRQALLLPKTAVMTDQVGDYVFVLDDAMRAQRKDITLGQGFEKYVEISKGLTASDKVVINGFINLSINQVAKPTEVTLEAMPAR